MLLLAALVTGAMAHAQTLERLPPVKGEHSAPVAASDDHLQAFPPQSQAPGLLRSEAEPTLLLDKPALLSESGFMGAVQQAAALQPIAQRDPESSDTQAQQRIRDLEGLGPAPGTTSEDENRSSGPVPDKPTVSWTGELQADDVMVSQSPQNVNELGQLQSFADFRRARLAAIGSLWANTIYRIEFDFAQEGRPSFLDVYGQFTDLAILGNVRIGHFFEPFAMSRFTSNRYQSFMERPLLDAFAPSRNIGVMAFDTYAEKRGVWQIGMFGADTNNEGEEQTNRGGEAVTGRLTYLPYWDEPSEGRYYMHLGGDFSFRVPGQQTARFGYWPGFRPGSFDNIVWPRWADTGNIAANNVTLFDLEYACVLGPFHVMSEFATNYVDQIGGPNLMFTAWYVETGWFLTGEHRPYQQEFATFNRVTPFEPFFFARTKDGIRRGRGAWQVVFRLDDLNLNNGNIEGGRLVDYSFGLNWYLNPYTRMYFNYVHAALDRGTPGSYGNLFGMRAQFEF
jgi:phosphate-selective porin OprO/OprP